MINKLKKISFALAITISLISITPHTTYASQNLSSQQINSASNWAKEAINSANKINLIPAVIQGNFTKSMNREEFSEFAVNLYEVLSKKKVTVQINNPFADTKNPKVIIAGQLGIVAGKGNRIFDPRGNVTREQASLIIYNTLKAAKQNYNYADSNSLRFKDASKISSWAKQAVNYLYGIEVINGMDANTFNPNGNISREQSIMLGKILYDKVIETDRASRNQITASRSGAREDSTQQSKLKDLISKELGKPYKWGATGPSSYDCSGLTYSLFGKLGIKIERTSKYQINAGSAVSKSNLQYGDLVLFARDGKNINHVGIYVGSGNFVHSPQTGDVVKISTLNSGYYANSYYAARRVLK